MKVRHDGADRPLAYVLGCTTTCAEAVRRVTQDAVERNMDTWAPGWTWRRDEDGGIVGGCFEDAGKQMVCEYEILREEVRN
jgi:hypothetical protein